MTHLLSAATADAYARSTTAVVERLAERFRLVDQPSSGVPRADLEALVDAVDLDGPGAGTDAALREVDELFTAHAVWFHHPAYQSHLNCPVALPAVAAEAVLAAVNPSVDTYDQSTVGTLVERRLIAWTAERAGLPADTADGVFTSGGTQSNLHALLLARERAAGRARRHDLDEEARLRSTSGPGRRPDRRPRSLHEVLERMVVLETDQSHFSVSTAARVLGLGPDSVVAVPTDDLGRMRPDALRVTLDALVQAGHVVVAVVATAGTTDRGCLDPLAAIADVCDDTDVWLHVDAAYGGGLLVSTTRRRLLEGVERARSVTVDFHKTFFQPVSSSALLVRDRADLEPLAWHADYLNPAGAADPNQVDKSLQTTRRLDALKLWATLRAVGADGLGAMIDRVVELGAAATGVVRDSDDLDLIGETQLSTVLFRWRPEGLDDAEADRLVPLVRRALFESGRAAVAQTVIDGRPCLKLTLLDPDTTLADVEAVLDLVRETASALHVDSTDGVTTAAVVR
ncbi:L-2,4-diaminobutyrate decarboxylase [Frigoribacterium sp. PvP120]|uniref:pyridoxal phosphate-dependent decarboxylase family protein n=1 Tax=Frigoribacterium sp. PvP121 TaxID=2806594 RepID=UPI001AE7B949|nr:L-2,4-diaminobutyrate decarboxylase [Frigoribacterium sp. PvP121]